MESYHKRATSFDPLPPLRPGQSEVAEIAGEPWVLHLLRDGLYVICELDGAGDCCPRALYRLSDRAEWGTPWGETPAERTLNFARVVTMFTRGGATLRLQEDLELFTIEEVSR